MVPAYEKLGVFYLGRQAGHGRPPGEDVLYPSRNLTTHAVCVGMTGSGKTGLAVGVLEEAALDGIPALVIDPKGDLGNLLLTFPDLRPADFEPWVDPDEAARKGLSVGDHAAATAEGWRKGLGDWGQDGARIRRLRDAAQVVVYTPGSTTGRPLALLRSLAAPVHADAETARETVSATVSALLGLLGTEADPMSSREHILLSRIVQDAWAAGRDLDLASLIRAVQKPGFDAVGVFDLESFYPAKERMGLAVALNNLLASPAAAAWTEGEPLDAQALLWDEAGKPRIAVLSIAHLSDAERMFFVATVLTELVAWMRRQAGTSSLRALLFMDEIAGYFPPTANPPSKAPMLTLLKQARAFGLGVFLATQNPVDLDYKGLSNCGTWFVGRLQTERDKLRLLDGLVSAAGGLDRGTVDGLLSGLGNRTFLLHDVRNDRPFLFQTRWTLSYLRGPLTREQLRKLQPPGGAGASVPPRVSTAAARATAPTPARAAAAPPSPAAPAAAVRPVAPAGLHEVWFGIGDRLVPGVYAALSAHYVDAATGTDTWADVHVVAPPAGLGIQWDEALEIDAHAVTTEAPEVSAWGALPAALTKKTAPKDLERQAAAWLYQARPLTVPWCPALKLGGNPGEAPGAFRARIAHAAREERQRQVEALESKLGAKVAALEEKARRVEAKLAKERQDVADARVDSAVSFGSTLLGALFGRKTFSATNLSKAGRAARSVGKVSTAERDVARAEDELADLIAARNSLEAELQAKIDELHAAWAPDALVVEERRVPAKKADTRVIQLAVCWLAGGRDVTGA